MIKQNKTFDKQTEELLKRMVGCELKKIVHDEFTYTNSVYGRVSLFISDRILNINNETEVVEFYGAKEDIALLSIKEVDINKVKSLLENKKQVEIPIRKAIKSIDIVNYHIYVKVDEKEYDNTWTQGIILHLDDFQVSFERSDSFTEMIVINRGYDIITKFTDVAEYGKEFINPISVKTKKEIIVIK